MTIKGLIEILSKLDQNLTVAMQSRDGLLAIELDEHSIVYCDDTVMFTLD